jgi:subtilase family serine protease
LRTHWLVVWAQSHGLTVSSYTNKVILGVTGTASAIEQAFNVSLNYRLRPDGSTFVALDREPSIDSYTTVLRVSGLTD